MPAPDVARPPIPPTVLVPATLTGGVSVMALMWGGVWIVSDLTGPYSAWRGLGFTIGVPGLVVAAVLALPTVAALAGWVASPWLMATVAAPPLIYSLTMGRDGWMVAVIALVPLGMAVSLATPSAQAYRAGLRQWRQTRAGKPVNSRSSHPLTRARLVALAIAGSAVCLTTVAAGLGLEMRDWVQVPATVTGISGCPTVQYTPPGSGIPVEAFNCDRRDWQVGEKVTVWIDRKTPDIFWDDNYGSALGRWCLAVSVAALLAWAASVATWAVGRRHATPIVA